MSKQITLLVIFFTILSGCASNQNISTEHRDQLDKSTIKAPLEVMKPDSMYYMGPGSAFGMMFGAIGGALTAAANLSPAEKLKLYAEEQGIHIEDIVREEVTNEFSRNGGFQFSNSDSNLYRLSISIPMYGFSIPNGFSSKLTPTLYIQCELFNQQGDRVWASKKGVSIVNGPVEPQKAENLINSPDLIEKAWRSAANNIAVKMLKELKTDSD